MRPANMKSILIHTILGIFVVATAVAAAAANCAGCVELDELTFHKIVSKFKYSIVKFDIAFPYGDKHEAYSSFAKNIGSSVGDLFVGLVGVKDYGEKENSALAARFKVDEKKFPVIILFKNYDIEDFVKYPEDRTISVVNIRKFVKEQTDLYIALDGCLKEFDEVVNGFVGKTQSEKEEAQKQAKLLQEKLSDEKDVVKAKIYLIIMQRILEKGPTFISDERRRLENLIQGKISDKKKRELTYKMNILESFGRIQEDAAKKSEL